jgi:gluconate 2-dehydrogenase gamma chain
LSDILSRRDFMASVGAIGATWLVADTAVRREAAEHAAHQVTRQQPELTFFTPEQAADVEAFASRIIPSDDTPGAREAGVVYFIDKSLTTWARDQQGAFRDGLARLQRDVGAVVRGQRRLSALTPEQQDAVLRRIENSDFFGQLRFATLAGMFSLPEHGGNRDFSGWTMIGQEPAMEYRPPYGWYDRPENMRALLGGGDA